MEFSSETDEDVEEVDENGIFIPLVQEGMRWDFRNETWNTRGFEYAIIFSILAFDNFENYY